MSAKNLRDIKNVADEEMDLLNDVRLSLISTLRKVSYHKRAVNEERF
jgi:hypothetical protein